MNPEPPDYKHQRAKPLGLSTTLPRCRCREMPVSEVSTVASLIQNRFQLEGGTGVCGTTVLDNFSCGILVILISKCDIAVFSEPAGCGFLAFWTVLKIILPVLRRFPSFFQFPTGHSQGNLAFMVTVNFNSLRRNRERVCYLLLIISQPRQRTSLIFSESKIT